MAETYKKIFPGNWVNALSAWPLPNHDFQRNKRAVGDPRDRQQQAGLVRPGVLAVHKVGHVFINKAVDAAATGLVSYDVTVASPDTRPDDKPRADVKGLLVPAGAQLYRVGLRVCPLSAQPNYPSAGAKDVVTRSGLKMNAGGKVWVQNVAGAPTAAPTAGAITTAGGNTPALTVGADNEFVAAGTYTALAAPAVAAADLTFKLWADKGGLGTSFLDGVYVVVEAMYLVNDEVADLSTLPLSGARYAGYTG